jgi:hypothetical protein
MSDVTPAQNGSDSPTPFLSNQAYDVLKFVALVLLPAVATLYFALSQIWGLPKGAEVVGSITAFDAFLGVILGISTQQYNNSDAKYDGSIDISSPADAPKQFSLNLDSDPYELESKKHITFKVNPVDGA